LAGRPIFTSVIPYTLPLLARRLSAYTYDKVPKQKIKPFNFFFAA
jgi:hypothetical protein